MNLSQINDTAYQSTSPKIERLEARVAPKLKKMFQQAAVIQGCSLTDFIIVSVKEAAIRTIQEHDIIVLTTKDREIFVKALLRSPNPNQKLRTAVQRYRKTIGV